MEELLKMAREAEPKTALEWACRIYCAEAEYLRKTEMHDNYTDRARSRAIQAKALEVMHTALGLVLAGVTT